MKKFAPTPSLGIEAVREVVADEIQKLPSDITKKGKYLCYVLRSDVAKARTYCGSTNDVVHRLRQHNGLIKGGARATGTTRPWRVAMIVYGFPDRSAALRYEFFTKMKHSRKEYDMAMSSGADSISRRAALLCAADSKCDCRGLRRYYGDSYMQECYEKRAASERAKTLFRYVKETPPSSSASPQPCADPPSISGDRSTSETE